MKYMKQNLFNQTNKTKSSKPILGKRNLKEIKVKSGHIFYLTKHNLTRALKVVSNLPPVNHVLTLIWVVTSRVYQFGSEMYFKNHIICIAYHLGIFE